MKICGICDFRKKISLGSLLIIINLIKVIKNSKKKKSILQIITSKKVGKDILDIAKAFNFIDKIEILSKIKIESWSAIDTVEELHEYFNS